MDGSGRGGLAVGPTDGRREKRRDGREGPTTACAGLPGPVGLLWLMFALVGVLSGSSGSRQAQGAQPPPPAWQAKLAEGHRLFAAGDYPAARRVYTEVVGLADAPGHAKSAALLQVAACHARQNKTPKPRRFIAG